MVKKRTKGKALPGKRYCKSCNNMIPIHSRTCSFCGTHQYTMQQLAKEYTKRLKVPSTSPPALPTVDFPSPFITNLPIEWYSLGTPVAYLSDQTWSLSLNSVAHTLPPLASASSKSVKLFNPGGEVVALDWDQSPSSSKYLAVSVVPYGDSLLYGRVYNTPGLIQVWKITLDSCSFQYGVQINSKTAVELKWLPGLGNEHTIGTLLAALGSGELHLYNLPFLATAEMIHLQPIEIFSVPLLSFSSVCWVPPHMYVAGGTQDGSLFLFSSGRVEPLVSVYGGHKLAVTGVCWSLESECLVTCGLDGYLNVWDLQGKQLDSLCSSKRWSYSVCASPVGNYIFVDHDGALCSHKVIKLEKGKLKNKKYVSVSLESTVSSCYSSSSSYDYIATVEGYIAAVYLSEIEQAFNKKKSPWSRYCRIISQSYQDGFIIKTSELHSDIAKPPVALADPKLFIKKLAGTIFHSKDLLAWGGHLVGVISPDFNSLYY